MTEADVLKLRKLLFFKGFEEVARGIAQRQNVPMDRARAILAAGTRRAGAAARKKNPHLNRVPGGKHNPRNKRTLHKAVILGRTYDQPIPMPMLSNGMPDWSAPDLNSYVSLVLNGSKALQGRVVVLHRLPNGMYRIAADETGVKNPQDRDKDKDKLKKETEIASQESHDTPVGEEVIIRSLSMFNQVVRNSFPDAKPDIPDYYGLKYSFFSLGDDIGVVTPKGYGPLQEGSQIVKGSNHIQNFLRKNVFSKGEKISHQEYLKDKKFIDGTLQKAMNKNFQEKYYPEEKLTPMEKIEKALFQKAVGDHARAMHKLLRTKAPGVFHKINSSGFPEYAGKFGSDGGVIMHISPNKDQHDDHLQGIGPKPSHYDIDFFGSVPGSQTTTDDKTVRSQLFDALHRHGVKAINPQLPRFDMIDGKPMGQDFADIPRSRWERN